MVSSTSSHPEVIKPKIVIPLLIIQSLLFALPLVLFLGLLILLPIVIISFVRNGLTGIFLIAFITFIVYLSIAFLLLLFRIRSLQKTEYKFHNDRIEYVDGFLIKHRKTIRYDSVSNIGQRTGILEGWFGLGSVFIDTAGYSPRGHELVMFFLDSPNEVYDNISDILSKKK